MKLDKIAHEFLAQNLPQGYNLKETLQDASLRKYYRVESHGSFDTSNIANIRISQVIFMDCPPSYTSIKPFLNVSSYLKNIGISVPSIYAYNEENGFILMEDFGDLSFNKLLDNGADEIEAYKTIIDTLIHVQNASQSSHQSIEFGSYTDDVKIREVNLFCKWYWQYATGEPMSEETQSEFIALLTQALARVPTIGKNVFVHKDYHLDNLIYIAPINGMQNSIRNVGVLDFQDALFGHRAGDVAMLLDDARRLINPELRKKMIDYYVSTMGIDKTDFIAAYDILSAQCNMRILGVFARKLLMDNNNAYAKRYMSNTTSYLIDNLKTDALRDLYAFLAHRINFT